MNFPIHAPVLPRRPDADFDLVALAASAGGVDAVGRLLAALPPELPVPVALVQHLAPAQRSFLVEVLRRRTRLAVCWAEDGARLRPGTVYVAPPDRHLHVGPRYTCELSDGPRENHARPAADALLRSAAEHLGDRALGVVLTGAGFDGAAGARALKARGGAVLVQDPATAVMAGMPRAVLRDGSADFVLLLGRLADAIVSLTMVRGARALFHVSRRVA